MTTQTEALKLLVEALSLYETRSDGLVNKALAAGKEALAQPEQEPVAKYISETWCGSVVSLYDEIPLNTFLYTTPPQRTWVGLSLQEQAKIMASIPDIPFDGEWHALLLNTIEAKLKEKNT